MYSTQAYIYQQLTRVLLIDTGAGETFTYRYDPVYAKRLTINKGVDNVILFEFINQQEKPVNITGSTFLFRVINTESDKLLLQKDMVILNGPTGRAKVTLDAEELLTVEGQPASYSIQRSSGNLVEAVFTDAQAGARAPVDIVDSVLPEFVPSSELTIPTTELSSQVTYGGSSYGAYPGFNSYWTGNPNGATYYNSWINPEFYSSFIEPRGPITTIQMTLLNYTGTIKAQAAENYQSIWYNVTDSTTYLNETKTIELTVSGWHPLLRVAFNNNLFSVPTATPKTPAVAYVVCTDGEVTDVVITNNGSGYLAPPRVDFIGDGAGATAVAILGSNGSVADIIVTNSGSGYWSVPNFGNPNAQPAPIPVNQQGAIVSINTGFVVDLLYR